MIEELGLDDPNIDQWSTNDNAANMIKSIRESIYLQQYLCDIHTLQLGINDAFKDVDGMSNVLNKSTALAAFTHKSNVGLQNLKSACKVKGKAFKKLKNPGDTRWNGKYTNMESILYLKDVLQSLFIEDEDLWGPFIFTGSDWKLLLGAVTVLKPFLVATKVLEAEKVPTINSSIEQIYTLHEHLHGFVSNPSNCSYGITFARALKKRLLERFPSCGMTVFEKCVANYLDPRFMGLHLTSWGKLEDIKSKMERKWNVVDDEEGLRVPVNPELSPTSKLLQRSRLARAAGGGLSKIKKEMATYESFSFASRKCDVLAWWKAHEEHLPVLAKIARKILAIPASSAKSERVFSTGGLVVTAKRGRLSPSKVEDLILLKQNLSRVRDFLAATTYKVEAGGHNAFQNIIVHVTEGADPVEAEDVNDDMYDLEGDDENEDENQDEEIVML